MDESCVRTLIMQVAKDRQKLGNQTHSCQPMMRPSIVMQDLMNEETYRTDYEKLTAFLIYDNVTYDECIGTLIEIKIVNLSQI